MQELLRQISLSSRVWVDEFAAPSDPKCSHDEFAGKIDSLEEIFAMATVLLQQISCAPGQLLTLVLCALEQMRRMNFLDTAHLLTVVRIVDLIA